MKEKKINLPILPLSIVISEREENNGVLVCIAVCAFAAYQFKFDLHEWIFIVFYQLSSANAFEMHV